MSTPDPLVCSASELDYKWSLYYHLPQEKSWALTSYRVVVGNINTIGKAVSLSEGLTDSIVRYCMLFIMREGIAPMWEDPRNRTGGAFSFKVANKCVPDVWRDLMFAMFGGSLMLSPKNNQFVNGITISPKKNFCIIKVWMSGCNLQDPRSMLQIDELFKQGCSFKRHEPEF